MKKKDLRGYALGMILYTVSLLLNALALMWMIEFVIDSVIYWRVLAIILWMPLITAFPRNVLGDLELLDREKGIELVALSLIAALVAFACYATGGLIEETVVLIGSVVS